MSTTSTTTTLHCPHCSQPMDVAADFEGGSLICAAPSCGKDFYVECTDGVFNVYGRLRTEDSRAVSTDESESSQDEAEGEAAFTHEAEEESMLAEYRAPMFRRHPLRFIGYAGLVVLGVVGAIIAIVKSSMPLAILAVLTAGTGIVMLALWYWRVSQYRVAITATSVVIDDGLASTKTREVHHNHITQIDIYQSSLCRILHTGGIEIAWGDKDDERMYIDSIEHPHQVVELIRKQASK